MYSGSIAENYIPILLFIVVGLTFNAFALLSGSLIRPNRPYRAKLTPYESGSPLFSDARVQFPMRYYIIAMLFVVFDIEIIFMIPWAIRFQSLGMLGLIEMLVFIAILLAGLWYAWKKGALEWD
ncbi:MAG: NADH-quinone oxidoreductase subunit A [Nitrospiraceae bacterium]|nr:MAG: NADH-quinone oxidoreductase subunit A [Nitrospiraceae bacterium]